MGRGKSFFGVFFSGIFGFLFSMLLLFFANIAIPFVNNPVFTKIVLFLDSNIWLYIIISFIFFISELFSALIFPFNLPYPIFAAIGSMFLLTFIYRIFTLVESMTGKEIFGFFRTFEFLIYPLLFIIIIIASYAEIFSRLFRWLYGEEGIKEMKTEARRARREKMKKTWEEVGDEFRDMLYDIAHSIRTAINPERKKKITTKKKKKRK